MIAIKVVAVVVTLVAEIQCRVLTKRNTSTNPHGPEHANAGAGDSGGSPGSGGEPMVPRTHVEGNIEAHHEPHHWSYSETDKWKNFYTDCGDMAQSPVNLVREDITEKSYQHLHFTYNALDELHIDNNGHNLQVNGNFGSWTVPDDMEQYNVAQFHFHFPSEHEIDGTPATGEIHIVHQKVGATGTDDLAVVAILLQEEGRSELDPALDRTEELAFLGNLGFNGEDLPQVDQSLPVVGVVDIEKAFKHQLDGDYWHYKGSLTTPPCSQTVQWYVLQEPAVVSSAMVEHFQTLFPGGNARPVNAKNDREYVTRGYD